MITADPGRRQERLNEVMGLLGREAAPGDLLLSFAPHVFAELPDTLALGLPAPALAARLRDHYDFFARSIPPSTQLYRGLPGLHVVVRNPDEGLADRTAEGLPVETTIVETHTLDAPFIFESLKNYFRRAGLRVYSSIHPILTVRRQWERYAWIGGPDEEEGTQELLCHFRIERIDSRERLRGIQHEVFSVLKSVFVAVEDFQDMRRSVRELAQRVRSRHGRPEEAASARQFLEWLTDDNYVFQGLVRYRVGPDGLPDRLHDTALGVFTDPAVLPVVFPGLVEEVESHIKPVEGEARIVDIDYCNNASAIYHLEPIDDIVVWLWKEDGTLDEAVVLMGRLAKGASTHRPSDIPLLREKGAWLLENCGFEPNTHAYRETRALYNRLPVRELFYADGEALKDLLARIVHMTSDDELVVHVRQGAGYEALAVAFARSRYSYTTEAGLKKDLAEAFGPVTFSVAEDLGGVSLLLFYFEAGKLEHPVDLEEARRLAQARVTTWADQVAGGLERAFGAREGRRLFERYIREESRSGLYRELTPPVEVPEDIRLMESLEARLEMRVWARAADAATLKLFSPRSLPLTDILRTLANLGLTVTDEVRVPLVLPNGRKAFMYRFDVEAPLERVRELTARPDRLTDALRAVDEGRATEDNLNGLVLMAGLSWREVEVLRTLRNHLLQVRSHYNAETLNGVLLRNSGVAAALYRLFAARFDPELPGDRAAAVAAAEGTLRRALDAVKSLAEDEVLRALDNLVGSVLRTNFYQRPERPVISIKVDSRKVEGMPSPRPMAEIYVHSPLLEGIHLRGGKVARGGIRWSDRHDDFRTEILGLMKTQMVKNSIIVPVGSKGGFVLKGSVPPRPALDAYLIDRYREFISGLLDVTDNIVDGHVVHPPEVVRYDGEDPYLVVAADKGTAHLSDTANSGSAQYGFWLGDAFASGGSAGYDHKKMGITARGAWECVKHHFHNLGRDIQKEPFTAVGIGDMSGDVFGNGVLLSPVFRLQAAFNHLHIFIDPEPDIERSFRERQRLFDLPRSGWRDYDQSLISAGGGIFDRSAKAIPLSPQVRALLGLEAETASGEEVVRKILTAPVDLLYNGGIGTYVRSTQETDAQVGDRTNDRVRVTSRDLRCKVIGEGGNLGMTQKARLEYWSVGGACNTDALDNSAGVDTSDHEVNIKILMDVLIKKGVVRGREERNRILAEMTEEVAALVLADNQNQARCLTLDGLRSAARYEEFVNFVEDLVAAGIVNRQDEALPTREELLLSPQRERGLPRPLMAVLLGYVKMWAFQMLLETDFPDDPQSRPLLDGYFPKRLLQYRDFFPEHRLRREIVATVAVNHLINEAGITFLSRVMGQTKAGLAETVAAWLRVDAESGAQELRTRIESAGLPAAREHELLLQVEGTLEELTRAVLAGHGVDAAGALHGVRSQLG